MRLHMECGQLIMQTNRIVGLDIQALGDEFGRDQTCGHLEITFGKTQKESYWINLILISVIRPTGSNNLTARTFSPQVCSRLG